MQSAADPGLLRVPRQHLPLAHGRRRDAAPGRSDAGLDAARSRSTARAPAPTTWASRADARSARRGARRGVELPSRARQFAPDDFDASTTCSRWTARTTRDLRAARARRRATARKIAPAAQLRRRATADGPRRARSVLRRRRRLRRASSTSVEAGCRGLLAHLRGKHGCHDAARARTRARGALGARCVTAPRRSRRRHQRRLSRASSPTAARCS